MLRHATGRSLLLFDEFGKGTNVIDGISVLAGVIRHLLARADCPRAIISTHFTEYLAGQRLLPDAPALSFVHMDTQVTEETDSARQEVVFLFKYTYSPPSRRGLHFTDAKYHVQAEAWRCGTKSRPSHGSPLRHSAGHRGPCQDHQNSLRPG